MKHEAILVDDRGNQLFVDSDGWRVPGDPRSEEFLNEFCPPHGAPQDGDMVVGAALQALEKYDWIVEAVYIPEPRGEGALDGEPPDDED